MVTDAPHKPDYGRRGEKKSNGLIVSGRILIAISVCMLLIVVFMWGASVRESIRPLVDLIGGISFFGFIPTGILGLVLLIVGMIRRRTT
jgi:hypothetical protein